MGLDLSEGGRGDTKQRWLLLLLNNCVLLKLLRYACFYVLTTNELAQLYSVLQSESRRVVDGRVTSEGGGVKTRRGQHATKKLNRSRRVRVGKARRKQKLGVFASELKNSSQS